MLSAIALFATTANDIKTKIIVKYFIFCQVAITTILVRITNSGYLWQRPYLGQFHPIPSFYYFSISPPAHPSGLALLFIFLELFPYAPSLTDIVPDFPVRIIRHGQGEGVDFLDIRFAIRKTALFRIGFNDLADVKCVGR